jgi:hypothetical protein
VLQKINGELKLLSLPVISNKWYLARVEQFVILKLKNMYKDTTDQNGILRSITQRKERKIIRRKQNKEKRKSRCKFSSI